MSKKKWKHATEFLWTLVLVIGFFLMSGGENKMILLISLAMEALALYKLGGIVDLEEVL